MNKISENKVKEIISDLEKFGKLNNSKHNQKYYYQVKNQICNSENISSELVKKFLDIYEQCKTKKSTEEVETDDRAITEVERDEAGKIKFYNFQIFRKNTAPLIGKLDRHEMELIYQLYSVYGANLTQKIVSRNFPQYTFIEFKRILRAFNIYKANSEFAPHVVSEKSEEELIALHNQNKENNVLRRIEKDQLSEANKLINKLAKENLELKNNFSKIESLSFDIKEIPAYHQPKIQSEYDQSIILHLSDLHIGSKCNSYTLYPNPWNETELVRRLNKIIDLLECNYGNFETIVLNLLGDMLDGMDNQTARRDHYMPQNMDNMEQVETFIQVMTDFIGKLTTISEKVIIYSVKCGNHDGDFGYVATLALQNIIKKLYPDIEFTLFKEFIGSYEFKSHQFCIMHGKDESFMKRPFPLVLDEKTKVLLYEWMESRDIKGGQGNVHFIKGDLHSEGLNNCNLFDYRNVLSLYGSSDYSGYNYSRNPYGLSYDYFIGNIRTIGTFENL